MAIIILSLAVRVAGVIHEHSRAEAVDDHVAFAVTEEVGDMAVGVAKIRDSLCHTRTVILTDPRAFADGPRSVATGGVDRGGADNKTGEHDVSRVAEGGSMGRWIAAFRMLAVVSGACVAQKYVPPPPPLTVDPCMAVANPLLPKDPAAKEQPVCPPPTPITPAPAAGNTAADQFPFPGQATPATKPTAAQHFPYPGSAPAPALPANKAADQFPYPGETSKSPDAVPEGDTKRYVPDAPAPGQNGSANGESGSSSSSSSSSSGGSGSESSASPGSTDDAAGDAAHARSHGRRALPKVSAVSPEDRVSDDLEVAKFYRDRGNFQAAYLRAKDATKLMPEDAETHFALAQAAEKLKRKDEAVAEYALYLKLDPAGQNTSAAQRALSQLR